jgi:hypothetical protein
MDNLLGGVSARLQSQMGSNVSLVSRRQTLQQKFCSYLACCNVSSSSAFVETESQATKNRCSLYLVRISWWWRMAFAKLVFPIPPVPKIEILGVPRVNISRRLATSASRPWKTFGSDGSRERELELNRLEWDHKFRQEIIYLWWSPKKTLCSCGKGLFRWSWIRR